MHLEPREKSIFEGKRIPAQCYIVRYNGDYIPLKNKPKAATTYSAYSTASIGHFDDTTAIVLICDKEKGKVL